MFHQGRVNNVAFNDARSLNASSCIPLDDVFAILCYKMYQITTALSDRKRQLQHLSLFRAGLLVLFSLDSEQTQHVGHFSQEVSQWEQTNC